MLEELPDLEGDAVAAAPVAGEGRARAAAAVASAEQPLVEKPAACEECGVLLTAGQSKVSMSNFKAQLCPQHQRGRLKGKAA
jgi:hypothetical protein